MTPAAGTQVASSQATQSAIPTSAEIARQGRAAQAEAKRSGYGLPCAKCKTYYAADLHACPVCKASERVSATAVNLPSTAVVTEHSPELDELEEERERFLREFKSQVYASHTQINTAAAFRCIVEANHGEEREPAAVCKGCYDHLQERVDSMEAALYMDVKAAAQVIYDAVWSDASDPNKTYQNAAQAILTELRKRAGMATIKGPLQQLPH